MNEVLEVSSDSSDTIIISPKGNLVQEHDSDSDVEALVQKYIAQNAKNEETRNDNIVNDFGHGIKNDYSDLGVPVVKRLKQSDSLSPSSSSQEESADDNEAQALQMLQEKYKTNPLNPNLQLVHQIKENIQPKNSMQLKEKDLQKQKKLEEKRQKSEELERQKRLKQTLTAATKTIKPADLKKFVTVGIDDHIKNEEYCNEITSALREMDVQYKFQSQTFSHTITWTRKIQSHSLDDNDKLVLTSKEQLEDQMLLIMNCKEFVQHIDNSTLCGHIQSLNSVLTNSKITLIVYGLQSYNRFMKNQHQKEMKNQLNGENEKPTTSKSFFRDFPQVTKQTIEHRLTELQILCSCSHRLIDSAADLGLLVTQFTKAVSEILFKQQRYEKFQQTDWFAAGDNRDSVKVDKNGNGLNRLWNQVLTTFPLARLETAEAISVQYPTMSALMTACQTTKEAELFLQDIPVRRAAGPLSSSRKIGPELSKKIYNFFTSTDGDALL